MKRTVATVCGFVSALVFASAAAFADPASCGGPEMAPHPETALPHVAAALKMGELEIVVVGSASSLLAPQAGLKVSYPDRLEAALQSRFPGLKITLTIAARAKRTAADMAGDLQQILRDKKPTLVIWQTGTVDAILGVEPDEFRSTLDQGLEAIRAVGADAVLMNMQYSPRTQSIIAVDAYLDIMRWVSFHHGAPLFDRFQLMRQWNEAGVFDLSATMRNFGQASRVHECLGRLLANFVVEAADMEYAATPSDAISPEKDAR